MGKGLNIRPDLSHMLREEWQQLWFLLFYFYFPRWKRFHNEKNILENTELFLPFTLFSSLKYCIKENEGKKHLVNRRLIRGHCIQSCSCDGTSSALGHVRGEGIKSTDWEADAQVPFWSHYCRTNVWPLVFLVSSSAAQWDEYHLASWLQSCS